jgi:hypothetical protein
VPIALLVLSRRRTGAAADRRQKEDVATKDGFGARIEPAGRGLLLLRGYGALEAAFEHTSRVERRLKTLAELRASAVTQCECMDFGSAVARDQGIDGHVLRQLPGYV